MLLLSSRIKRIRGGRELCVVNLVARQIEAVDISDDVRVVRPVDENTGLRHHQTDKEFIRKRRRRLALGKYGNQFIAAVQPEDERGTDSQ